MAAAQFSGDVLEMFYGPISNEAKRRLEPPIRPKRGFDFENQKNNFNGWLNVWRMDVPEGNKDLLKFFQKKKTYSGNSSRYLSIRTAKSPNKTR